MKKQWLRRVCSSIGHISRLHWTLCIIGIGCAGETTFCGVTKERSEGQWWPEDEPYILPSRKAGLFLRRLANIHRWGPCDIMFQLQYNHHKNPILSWSNGPLQPPFLRPSTTHTSHSPEPRACSMAPRPTTLPVGQELPVASVIKFTRAKKEK